MKKTLTVICAALMLSAPLASFAQPGPPDRHDGGPSHQGNPPHGQPQQQGRHDNGRGPAYRDPNFRPQ
ncbi:integral membrane-like protein [Pseudomonas sp. S37]|nr:integral membrane-like protein [Pseudomonas sp. S37]